MKPVLSALGVSAAAATAAKKAAVKAAFWKKETLYV
jgi:hypothetical protein